jgi:signal peptidase I
MGPLSRIYAVMLYAYPRAFRKRFGVEMRQVFRDRCRVAAETGGSGGMVRVFARSAGDWLVTAVRERLGEGMDFKAMVRRPATIWMLGIFTCLFASTTMVRAYVIPTDSMAGTLRTGDHVLADRMHSKSGEIERGDVITFHYPEDSAQIYIKRVIGLPGDRIRMGGKQVIRNGRRLGEPYALHSAASMDAYRDNFPAGDQSLASAGGQEMLAHHVTNGEAVVPDGSLFVLGDNRDISWDSRYWGFVPRENVIGKPWVVFWSYDAPTQDLAEWNRAHLVDLAEHFFTKTRWSRTFMVLRPQRAAELQP